MVHDVYFLKYDRRNHGDFHGQFLVYGKTFDHCLGNLNKVLQRCQENALVLNWEKCHFIFHEGIVLGHLVSERVLVYFNAHI